MVVEGGSTACVSSQPHSSRRTTKTSAEDMCSRQVTDNQAKPLPADRLRDGFEKYSSTFDEHFRNWLACDLTADKLALAVVAQAAQIRASGHETWSAHVKAEFPILLGGIFALYAIIRSGDSYRRLDNAQTERSSENEKTESENLSPEDSCVLVLIVKHV